jgi:hypothetical protein
MFEKRQAQQASFFNAKAQASPCEQWESLQLYQALVLIPHEQIPKRNGGTLAWCSPVGGHLPAQKPGRYQRSKHQTGPPPNWSTKGQGIKAWVEGGKNHNTVVTSDKT